MKTAIIGAGPVGCCCGYLLAKNKHKFTDRRSEDEISIFEEHSKIGVPEQCTGLISKNILDFVDMNELNRSRCIQNRIKGAVFSCMDARSEIRASDTQAFVFDRTKFDELFAHKAKKQGVDIYTGHKYISHKKVGDKIKLFVSTNQSLEYVDMKHVYADILIGADGPNSQVAQNSGLFGKRNFYYGNQAVIRFKKPDFDRNLAYLHFDKKYTDKFFAWLVPIDEDTAKVGLASLSRPYEYLNRFLKDEFGSGRFKVQNRQGGLIPIYSRQPVSKDNVFLAGDAALQVKATTGGGVINGLYGAEALAGSISDEKLRNGCDASYSKSYEKRLSGIRRNLWLHSVIRRRLNRFSDQDYVSLIKKLENENVRKLLVERGDMDFPLRFGLKLIMEEPSFLRFLMPF